MVFILTLKNEISKIPLNLSFAPQQKKYKLE